MSFLHYLVPLHFMASGYKSNILAKFASTRATFYLISMNLRKTAWKRQKFQPTECHISRKLATLFHLLIAKTIITSTLWKNIQKCMIIINPWLSTWVVIIKMEMSRCSAFQSLQSGKRLRHSQHLTCLEPLGQGWAHERDVTVRGRRQGLGPPAWCWE